MDTSQLDHYAYTQDNPVNPSDPSGHDPLDEDALVTIAFVTAGSIGIRMGVGEIIREILTDLLILLGVIGLGWIIWWQLTHPRSTARPTAIPRPQPTTEPDTYIYRQGPDRPKTVALRRLDD